MNIRILIRNIVGKGPPVHTAGLPPAADRARFAPCREAALSSPPAPGVPAREDFIFCIFLPVILRGSETGSGKWV